NILPGGGTTAPSTPGKGTATTRPSTPTTKPGKSTGTTEPSDEQAAGARSKHHDDGGIPLPVVAGTAALAGLVLMALARRRRPRPSRWGRPPIAGSSTSTTSTRSTWSQAPTPR